MMPCAAPKADFRLRLSGHGGSVSFMNPALYSVIKSTLFYEGWLERRTSMSKALIRHWAAVTPLVMSAMLLSIVVIGQLIPLGPSIPIHDEYLADHLAMLLFFGQIPVLAFFALHSRRQIERAIPILAVQLLVLGVILVVVSVLDRQSREMVARRVTDQTPLPGSAVALRRLINAEQRGELGPGGVDRVTARYLRQNVSAMRALLSLGPLLSLDFRRVDAIGWDVYDARFTLGEREIRLFTGPGGIIHGLTLISAAGTCSSSEIYECRSGNSEGKRAKLLLPRPAPAASFNRQPAQLRNLWISAADSWGPGAARRQMTA